MRLKVCDFSILGSFVRDFRLALGRVGLGRWSLCRRVTFFAFAAGFGWGLRSRRAGGLLRRNAQLVFSLPSKLGFIGELGMVL